MTLKIFKLICTCLLCVSALGAETQNKKDSDIVSVKNVNGFTFAYRKCWRVSALELEDISQDDNISFYPTSKCTESPNDTWQMEISSAGAYTNEEYEKERNGVRPEFYREERKVGPYRAIVFEGVTRETSKLVDMESQKNLYWTLKVTCKKMNLTVLYVDHLQKQAREEVRKNPKIPPPFQFLIDHFSCE